MSLQRRNWLATVAVLLGLMGLPQLGWAQGKIESPEEASVQSGVALIRGWVCAASVVELELDASPRVSVPYKIPRGDTQGVCGDADNGFAAVINWNDVTPGLHTLRAYADGVLLGQVAFAVTTLGLGSFPQGLSGQFAITDFPLLGQTVEIEWREAAQNFILRSGGGSGGSEQQSAAGRLESPETGKTQSGIELIRGWVCTANVVEVELDGLPRLAVPYKIPRGDTQGVCGDADNGFVALVNWNDVTPGAHTLRAYADGVLFASVEFHVTSLGLGSFPQGLDKAATLPNFPQAGTSVHVRWQESRQNFGLEGVLQAGQSENLCGTQSSQILDQNGAPGSVEVNNPCTPTGDVLGFDPSVPIQVTGSATQRQARSAEAPLRLCVSDIVIIQGGVGFTSQAFRWVDGQGNEIMCQEIQPGQTLSSLLVVRSGIDLNFNEAFQLTYGQKLLVSFSSTAPPRLTVGKGGNGSGTVKSDPVGITCGLDCSQSYAQGTVVTLVAAPDADSTFSGWSGDCRGNQSTVQVVLTTSHSCTATFARTPASQSPLLVVSPLSMNFGEVEVGQSETQTITVTNSGGGLLEGSVTTNAPFSIVSGGTFAVPAGQSQPVQIRFSPTVAGPVSDQVTVSANGEIRTVTLTGDTPSVLRTLTVTTTGSGSGFVDGPTGILCGSSCSQSYKEGTVLTLRANPSSSSMFAGWGGDCSGAALTTQVSMTADRRCTATFDRVGRTSSITFGFTLTGGAKSPSNKSPVDTLRPTGAS